MSFTSDGLGVSILCCEDCALRLGDLHIKSKLYKKKEVTQLVEPVILGWTEESKSLTVFLFPATHPVNRLPASLCRLPGLAAEILNEPLLLSPL